VITEEDLIEPEVDAGGEPGPAIAAWRGEAAFVSALLAVTDDRPPLICFSKGHGEPDLESVEDGGYASFAESVRRDGDETRALDKLAELGAAGCRVLVVAEPTRAFSDAELAAVESFVDAGGRLLVMVGPVFAPGGAAFAHLGLETLAARYGVTLEDDLVVDPTHASDVEGPSVWAAGRDSYLPHPVTARLGGRLTFWPRTRQVAPLLPVPAGLVVAPLVRTSAEGWGETDLPTIRGDADLTFDAGRDRHGPVTVAVAVERAATAARPATRLAFLGTGRLVMNYRLSGVTLRDYDADFVLSTIGWLADREARIGVGPRLMRRVALSLTAADVSWAFRLFVIGLPLLALGAGVWVGMRRRI
jgi:hypothetical protein